MTQIKPPTTVPIALPESYKWFSLLSLIIIAVGILVMPPTIKYTGKISDYPGNMDEQTSKNISTLTHYYHTSAVILLALSIFGLTSGHKTLRFACKASLVIFGIEFLGFFSFALIGMLGFMIYNPFVFLITASIFGMAYIRTLWDNFSKKVNRTYIMATHLAALCFITTLYLIVFFDRQLYLGWEIMKD